MENLEDYGCPKYQNLVGEGKTDSSWICFSYVFRHKTRLHCTERRAKVYGEWAVQRLIFSFLYVFIVFEFTLDLVFSTRYDFFCSIHFEKLSLRNR